MLRYLWDWTWELVGRSGVGMDGYAPLSYATVESWARLTGRDPTHQEVEALMALDSAIRNPDAGKPEKKEPEPLPAPAWPERRLPPVLIPSD